MNTLFSSGVNSKEDFIPLLIPEIGGNEWNYVKDCLDTGWISSVGSYVNQFEDTFAKKLDIPYSIATVNGTSALHVALLVAGVKPDDEVFVSTLTFIAPVNAIRYVNAWPVFIDADSEHWQMDPNDLESYIGQNCEKRPEGTFDKLTSRIVKAIIPVHILGYPCDMDSIKRIADEYNLVIIEDATESLGALYKKRKIGTIGDIGCFSFNGNKVISNGGGGMIVTKRKDWAERAKYLTTQAKDDPLEFVHETIGYNYRMTNILAAIGLAQLEKLDEFLQIKHMIAQHYETELSATKGISFMSMAEDVLGSKWLNTILIDEEDFGINSRELINFLLEHGIESRPLWQPIHLSPAYQNLDPRKCVEAERLNRLAISLPSSVGLTFKQREKVISVINKAHR
jgi:perosamine synthetase